MKQIIVMTKNREQFERKFSPKLFHVTWCELSVSALIKVRDRSDQIFVCLDHEDHDELLKLGMYLKDLCIEYEKCLYLFGNIDDVETIRSLVPSLYVKNTQFAFVGMDSIVDELKSPDSGMYNPGFLMIDDDSEYIEILRAHLSEYFNVYVSHYDPDECEHLTEHCVAIMMSTEGMLKMSQLIRLLIMIYEKRMDAGIHYYLIAPTNIERDLLYEKSDRIGISLSKEVDTGRIAKYLIERAKQREAQRSEKANPEGDKK